MALQLRATAVLQSTNTTTTTRTITIPAGTQVGDLIFIFAAQSGGSTTQSMTSGSGYTLMPKESVTSHGCTAWHKIAEVSDAGSSITLTSSASIRTTVVVGVFYGQSSVSPVGPLILSPGTNTLTKSVTSGTVGVDSGVIQFACVTAGNGLVTNITASGGYTRAVQTLYTDTPPDAFAPSLGALFYEDLLTSGGTAGGNTITMTGNSTYSPIVSVWTIPIELAPVSGPSDTVRPTSTVGSSGVTAVGAASVHATLADESQTTYAETVENPGGSYTEVLFPEVGAGLISAKYQIQSTASTPNLSCVVQLRQGTTVIASRTHSMVPTTITEYEWTATSAEVAAITDRTNLRLRWTWSV